MKGIKYIIAILLVLALGYGSYIGAKVLRTQDRLTQYQEDLAEITRVNYGIFNVYHWKQEILGIFNKEMNEFEISPQVYAEIEAEIAVFIRSMFDEYISSGKLVDELIDDAVKSGKLNKMFATLIRKNVKPALKGINFDAQIPQITKNLSAELKRREPQLKQYFIDDFNEILHGDGKKIVDPRLDVYKQYGTGTLKATTDVISQEISTLKEDLKKEVWTAYLLLALATLAALLLYRVLGAQLSLTLTSVGAIVLLIHGVLLPMMQIDARLSPFSIDVMGGTIPFEEQSIYFQSKSILQVIDTMLSYGGLDMKIVAYMILAFSVLIPLIKLVLTTISLYSARLRSINWVQQLIYHIGKWSMADVFVVALFMGYIGMHGVVTAQLSQIERNDTGFAVDTLNYSGLSYGALFFTTYCIFSIVLGIYSKKANKES